MWRANRIPGVFLAVSSVHAKHAVRRYTVYEMTTVAIEGLVRNLAVSYSAEGIRAVGVAPGAITTPAGRSPRRNRTITSATCRALASARG